MNAYQTVLNQALQAIRFVLAETQTDTSAKAYWNKVMDDADGKIAGFTTGHKGGDIQAQFSNPLAYFLVPFYGHGLHASGLSGKPRGRSYEETMRQLVACGVDGLTTKAADILRVSSRLSVEDALRAEQYAKLGLTHTFLKASSPNKEIRGSLNKRSALARQLRQVPELEESWTLVETEFE